MQKDTAIFAAGCFWGVQYYFDQVPGVLETEAGYTGGHTSNPTYWDVVGHKTGHLEAIQLIFDPAKVGYETLLKHFFRIQDPTSKDAPDGINRGDNYRSAIFYTTEQQKKTAQQLIDKLNKEKYGGKIATELIQADKFWPAENEHQKFTQRTGVGACHIDYAPVS
jgi:peptide methionine sulfoxide reductase msrA/msrB